MCTGAEVLPPDPVCDYILSLDLSLYSIVYLCVSITAVHIELLLNFVSITNQVWAK